MKTVKQFEVMFNLYVVTGNNCDYYFCPKKNICLKHIAFWVISCYVDVKISVMKDQQVKIMYVRYMLMILLRGRQTEEKRRERESMQTGVCFFGRLHFNYSFL